VNASAYWGRTAKPRLAIGLVNNMGDGALAATERQFAGLLEAAACEAFEIDLRLFHFSETPRGELALTLIADRYVDVAALPAAGLDGLIVTGAEPKAVAMDAEAYWPAMAKLVDHVEGVGLPTIWSCLAAHAAVLRLDGVRRRPLPTKLSGVYASDAVWHDPLLIGLPQPPLAPHSRLNTLDEVDLVVRGYRVLTRSADAGVDTFLRRGAGLSLFLQGHPEYDAETLMREYARDIGRFARGERPTRPAIPIGYFDDATELALAWLKRRHEQGKVADLPVAVGEVLAKAEPAHSWRAFAVGLYRNWLREVASLASARAAGAVETVA